jgi:dihydrofolate reductase
VIGPWRIHGHAIVSADDKIAGPDGLTPPELRNEADWLRFQQALDEAAVTVLGRLGHKANANVRGRNRLVLSSSAKGVERRSDGWWWNPADVPLEAALREAAPAGGIVTVPGGRQVFDLFLGLGFDEFHLARAQPVRLPQGIPVFSGLSETRTADALLAARGLVAGNTEVIDSTANVTLTRWHRPFPVASPA